MEPSLNDTERSFDVFALSFLHCVKMLALFVLCSGNAFDEALIRRVNPISKPIPLDVFAPVYSELYLRGLPADSSLK